MKFPVWKSLLVNLYGGFLKGVLFYSVLHSCITPVGWVRFTPGMRSLSPLEVVPMPSQP